MAVLYLTFTCLEVGAQKKWQVPGLSFSTNYSMSYLCLHFCLKVTAELSLQVSAIIINNKVMQPKIHFFLQTISKFISFFFLNKRVCISVLQFH